MKKALVIGGGGSKGAFAVGAVETLRKNGVDFDIVAGASTGALIAPFVVTDEIQLLRYIYTSVHTADILRRRSFLEARAKDALYDTRPLHRLIHSFITEERYERIVRSPKELILTTVNLQNGKITYWCPHWGGRDNGPLSRDSFIRAALASASVPVMMPPVRVGANRDRFVDGGVRSIAPLRIAIDRGAEDIYAIVLSPEHREVEDRRYVFLLDILMRTLDLLTDEVAESDVVRAVIYNRAIRYLSTLRKKAEEILTPEQFRYLFDDPENPNHFEDKRLLNLYLIRPEKELPGETMTFDPVAMSEMAAYGVEAAQNVLKNGPIVL